MTRRHASIKSLPNGTAHKQTENFECLPYAEETMGILHQMLELSLLKDPVFLLFTLSNFCTSIGFNIPYVYLVVRILSILRCRSVNERYWTRMILMIKLNF